MTEEKIIVKSPPRSPALAGILAFFFPFGVGAFYNRQIVKGFMFLFILAGLITIQTTGEGQPFWGILLGGFYFYQIFDAIQDAKRYNKYVMSGGEEDEATIGDFPDAVKSGSIFWGIVLIALGGLFLLANFEVIDYDIIWDFWPLAIILVGFKYVADYFLREKKAD
jgi:hypothetical protein